MMCLLSAQKIAAGGDAFAGRDHVDVRPVGVHDVLLVAFAAVARRLEDQPLPVRRPVRFGVLPARSELLQVIQMLRCAKEWKQNQKLLHRTIIVVCLKP